MTQQHFNSYKEGLDLQFLYSYCMEHGELRSLERGETLEEAGRPSRWVAYVERGCFKYMVHNNEEGKDYYTGFAFEGEFVADYPYCLHGDKAEVTIEADMPCKVRIIAGADLQRMFDEDIERMRIGMQIMQNLFKMVYARNLDHYRYTARGRYQQLLARCPQVVQLLSLKDIASFLNVTPAYLSKIRREITFGKEKSMKSS